MHGFFFNPPIEDNYIGHQIKEIYFDKVYDNLVKDGGVCLDIGGNIGMTSYFFSKHFDRVITMEPSAQHFEVLNSMLKYNKIKNVETVNKALFIKDGKYNFYHNKNKTMFSLNQVIEDGSSAPEPVETITLKKLFEDKKIDTVNLLKIDVEGSEIEIFSHSDFKELAPKIKTVITERHAWNGRNPNQLDDALKIAGYKIEKVASDADLVIAHYNG